MIDVTIVGFFIALAFVIGFIGGMLVDPLTKLLCRFKKVVKR
jgi:hypothetical protein